MTIDTKALRELYAAAERDPDDMDNATDLDVAAFNALPALLDAADRLARIEQLAATGTAQAFAALPDADKLRWWVATGQRDQEQSDRLAALETENQRLRVLLSDVTSVAITMLYSSHKDDTLATFSVPELNDVVARSEHLQPERVEHIYRRGYEALAAGGVK